MVNRSHRFEDGERLVICEETRFSEYVNPNDEEGRRDLERWVEWFRSRGINAIIVSSSRGYAVYRNGLNQWRGITTARANGDRRCVQS